MKKIPRRVLLLLLLFVIFCLHSTYLPNGFTWLDHGDIEAGRTIVTLSELPQIILTPFGATGFYRPLVTLFNSVDYAIYNSFAPGYHMTNVLLHIAVTAAVPLFLSVFFSLTFLEVLLIIVIVGLHPFGWLPVGAIAYRSELLVTLFVLLTVYFHAKAGERRSPYLAILATLCFFFGLLAKETALVIIPMLILFWELAGKRNKKGRPVLLLYIPELLVIILYLIMRLQAVPDLWRVSYFQGNWMEQIGTRIAVLEKLLIQFVNPFKPSLSDAVQIAGLGNLSVLAGIALIVTAVYFIVKTKNRALIIAFILFGLLLTPALNLVPVPRLGSPHYGYIAMAGFAAIVIVLLRICNKSANTIKNSVYVIFSFWLVIMTITTISGGANFKNDLTLFGPEVAKDTDFREGYFYLGNYYALRQDFLQAESAYVKALQQNPKVIAYHETDSTIINLSLLKLSQGKKNEAKKLLESILPLEDPVQTKKLNEFIKSL